MNAKPTQSAAQRAESFLRRYLPSDGTPRPSLSLQQAACGQVAPRTLQRAVHDLGITVTTDPNLPGRQTLWAWPADQPAAGPEPPPAEPPTANRRGLLTARAQAILRGHR